MAFVKTINSTLKLSKITLSPALTPLPSPHTQTHTHAHAHIQPYH